MTVYVVFSLSGDSEPAEPGIPQDSSLSIPVGVPLPPEHYSHRLQLLGIASQQHQLPGNLHDQCWTLLCGPTDLWQYGNVPRGTAALQTWQSIPFHLRLLCRICDVLGDRHCCAGARLADLLQQEAVGPVVHHHHTGEEEEMSCMPSAKILCQFAGNEALRPDTSLWTGELSQPRPGEETANVVLHQPFQYLYLIIVQLFMKSPCKLSDCCHRSVH